MSSATSCRQCDNHEKNWSNAIHEAQYCRGVMAKQEMEIDQLKLQIATYHDKHRELQGKYLDVCSKLNRIACVLKGDAR